MICPNCGHTNSDDATFCTSCGQRFAPPVAAEPAPTYTEQTSNPQQAYTESQNTNPNYTQAEPHTTYNNASAYGQTTYTPSPNTEPTSSSNGFAVASLVLGIVSVIFSVLLPFITLPASVVGLIMGIMAMKRPYGKGMSIAGIVLNSLGILSSILFLIAYIWIIYSYNTYGYGAFSNWIEDILRR